MTKDVVKSQTEFPIAWTLDRSKFDKRIYKGYAAGRKPSDVSGQPRLFYDRTKPYTRQINFYNYFTPDKIVTKPRAYIIPQGWWKVIERLEANGVVMKRFSSDTTLEVEAYRIASYQSGTRPYEGHHINYQVKVQKSKKQINFRKGDYYIPLNQAANRFLVQVLEPHAEDSYFAWNFFDPILGQKEGYSDYVFEETAAKYLEENPELNGKILCEL